VLTEGAIRLALIKAGWWSDYVVALMKLLKKHIPNGVAKAREIIRTTRFSCLKMSAQIIVYTVHVYWEQYKHPRSWCFPP
jgi:hypothetical protein